MAGLFRAPKPVVPAPQPVLPTPEPAAAIAQAREATQGEIRARRGITGTIATSARGVLAPLPVAVTRKSLLGE